MFPRTALARLLGSAVGLFCFFMAGILQAGDEARPLYVEGYAGRVSYAPGNELTLHVSSSAATFSVEIARLGAKVESVWTNTAVPGRELPVPENASSHGCRWPVAVTLKIPSDWRSGYYHVTFRATRHHAVALPMFCAVAGIGFLLNIGAMALLTKRLGVYFLYAQVVTTGLLLLWHFAANRLWTFRPVAR